MIMVKREYSSRLGEWVAGLSQSLTREIALKAISAVKPVCLVVFISLCLNRAEAYDVKPARLDFDLGKPAVPQYYQVLNDSSEPVVLTVTPNRLEETLDGGPKLTKVTNEFEIFPNKLVVGAGKSQRVRVNYVGTNNLSADAYYRMVFRSLPVTMGMISTNAGIRVATEYLQLAVVRRANHKPKLELDGVSFLASTTNRPTNQIEIRFRNDGTALATLTGFKAKGSIGNGGNTQAPFVVSTELFPNIARLGVLPGGIRRLLIGVPPDWKDTNGTVSVQF